MTSTETHLYDVALSFAGEDRDTVALVADFLRARGVRVFYDEFETVDLWGKHLQSHLTQVYFEWSRYAIVFVSIHYRDKIWTRHELRAVLGRAALERTEYVLPVRFDDTALDGLLPTIGYLDLRRITPAEVGAHACRKLGIGSPSHKADQTATPWSRLDRGTAAFDYSSHNGRYRIGKDLYLFETDWSKAGARSIHCYSDPSSLHGIALAPQGASLSDLTDALSLDYTSRSRSPGVGRIVVLQNSNGFFAALRIIDVQSDTHGATQDLLAFEYIILRDGSRDFSFSEWPQAV